jgi:hypothetical protein
MDFKVVVICVGYIKESITLRVCLHVSESPYESLYDSMHDFYANIIGIQLFFCHPLQWFVVTFQPKKMNN